MFWPSELLRFRSFASKAWAPFVGGEDLCPRTASVVAHRPVVCAQLSRETFLKVVSPRAQLLVSKGATVLSCVLLVLISSLDVTLIGIAALQLQMLIQTLPTLWAGLHARTADRAALLAGLVGGLAVTGGLFLSGGLDSCVVGSLMRPHAPRKLPSFTVGQEGSPEPHETRRAATAWPTTSSSKPLASPHT